MAELLVFEDNKIIPPENLDYLIDFLRMNEKINGFQLTIRNYEKLVFDEILHMVEKLVPYNIFLLLDVDISQPIDDNLVALLDTATTNYAPRIYLSIVLDHTSDLTNITPLLKIKNPQYITIKYVIKTNEFDLQPIVMFIRQNMLYPAIHLEIDHQKKLDYKKVGISIDNATLTRKKQLVGLRLGCGFPLCMFSNDQIGNIYISPMKDFNFICMPQPIIHTDLSAQYCYLSEKRINIKECDDLLDLIQQLTEQLTDVNNNMFNCKECWSFNKLCFGGCKFT